MQKIEISLQKRTGKMLLYLPMMLVCIFAVIGLISSLIAESAWYYWVLLVIFLGGSFLVINGLIQYFLNKEAKLVVESDGQKIKFYNINEAGKTFNESDEWDLAEFKRFYVVEKTSRFLIKDRSFAFEPKSGLLTTDVDCFPELWEAKEDEIKLVLGFVKSVAPDIELGYENIWQKMTKK